MNISAKPRFPVVATLFVLVAVGIMVRLGIWQLERLHQKEAMIARYSAALSMPLLDWSTGVPLGVDADFRRVRLPCTAFINSHMTGGRNANGQPGWVQWVDCISPSGSMQVVVGWSANLAVHPLQPTVVTGIVVGDDRAKNGSTRRIIADPPLGGLQANNHFSYAVQWFLFAATALVIYAIALWRRLSPKSQ